MNTDKIPVLYEKDRPQAVFTKAFNIITVAEVNAESYLEFDLYFLQLELFRQRFSNLKILSILELILALMTKQHLLEFYMI